MKRWLIVLCFVLVHDSAIAATAKKADVPFWKQFLSLFSPPPSPTYMRRHARHEHDRVAEPELSVSPETLPEAPHVRRQRAAEPVRFAEPATTAPAETPTVPTESAPASSAGPPLAPSEAPVLETPALRPRRGESRCESGQRIVSAYYWGSHRTASGQPFDPRGLTAAHRSLPFGTRLTVINPRTGQSVTVTINDRGPYVRGVSLDLSLGAAQAIGMHGTGAVCIL